MRVTEYQEAGVTDLGVAGDRVPLTPHGEYTGRSGVEDVVPVIVLADALDPLPHPRRRHCSTTRQAATNAIADTAAPAAAYPMNALVRCAADISDRLRKELGEVRTDHLVVQPGKLGNLGDVIFGHLVPVSCGAAGKPELARQPRQRALAGLVTHKRGLYGFDAAFDNSVGTGLGHTHQPDSAGSVYSLTAHHSQAELSVHVNLDWIMLE